MIRKLSSGEYRLYSRKINPKTGKRRSGKSEYGKQMLEKQKVRVTYGLPERQFRNYVNKALESHAVAPKDRLHELLEMRLDNLVYRLGFARSRAFARQMVGHGHIKVNGRRVNISRNDIDRVVDGFNFGPHVGQVLSGFYLTLS